MTKKIIKNLTYFLLSLFIVAPLKSVIIVDFDFRTSVARVIAYNVSTQRLLSYDEIDPTKSWSKMADLWKLAYTSGGNVAISYDQQPKFSLMVLSNGQGQLQSTFQAVSITYPSGLKGWSSQTVTEKDPATIVKFLPKQKKKLSKGSDLPITRFSKATIVETLASLDNGTKGEIGERVTLLTFLAFWYEPLSSKYEEIHGLDGIFRSWSGKYLFLTQSKQRGTSQTAANVVKKELNEPKLADTIKKMETCSSTSTKNTAVVVRKFLDSTPDNAYKFGHRVADDGQVQYHIEALDVSKFPTSFKITGASHGQKVQDVCSVVTKYEDSREKQLDLLFSVLLAKGIKLEEVSEMYGKVSKNDNNKKPELEEKKEAKKQDTKGKSSAV